MSTNELLQKWYEEVWNNDNENFIDEWMDKNTIIHGLDPSGTMTGIDNFKLFYKNLRTTFPNIHIQVIPLVHDHEYATAYCLVTAKNSKNQDVSFTGLSVIRVKGNKLIEGWNNFDFLKMYQQLGHILVSEIEEK